MSALVEDRWRAKMQARPNTRVITSDPYLDPEEGERVDFRLTYQGPLFAARSNGVRDKARAPHKHDIRRVFHKQLKHLWYTHPALLSRTTNIENSSGWFGENPTPQPGVPYVGETYLNSAKAYYSCHGFNWVPLVTERMSLLCRLEILMLRPQKPGGVVQHGDIDNRIKTLFDAMKRPTLTQEIGADAPLEDEDPFFVLLEDDSLISHVSVETDTLLEPINDDPNEVRLIIKVTVRPYEVYPFGNADFLA